MPSNVIFCNQIVALCDSYLNVISTVYARNSSQQKDLEKGSGEDRMFHIIS